MEKFKVKFNVSKQDFFYAELKEKINAYFSNQKNSDHANAAMIIKMVVIGLLFFGSYFLLLSTWFNELQMLLLAIVFGFANALIAFNIAHDAAHNALFKSKKWNMFFSYSFNLIGVNRYIWHIKHNLSHHTFTNVPGYDMDIEQIKVARIVPHVPLKWFYRYQHLYVPFLYPFAGLYMILIKDFQMFATKKFGTHIYINHPKKEYFILIASKLFYLLYAVVIPLVIINIVWWKFLIGFMIMHMVLGVFLAIILFPAHALDDSPFPEPDEKGNINNSWVIHEIETTTNFSPNSHLLNWVSGGLNTHIIHHLFPGVCHIHYFELTKIVRQTALKHNIKIRENSLWGAVSSHWRLLKYMGSHEELNIKTQGTISTRNELAFQN